MGFREKQDTAKFLGTSEHPLTRQRQGKESDVISESLHGAVTPTLLPGEEVMSETRARGVLDFCFRLSIPSEVLLEKLYYFLQFSYREG